MHLVEQKRRCKLANLRPGLFVSAGGELCVKTEYGIDSYIVSTGEYFWGGATTRAELDNVLVTPVDVAK